MPVRKGSLVTGEFYHIYSRSISKINAFRHNGDLRRMRDVFKFYLDSPPPIKYSDYLQLNAELRVKIDASSRSSAPCVDIVAYCILNTHFHLLLRQNREDGISDFMRNALDSYTKYLNKASDRKGPLWESRFSSVLIEDDDQLLTTVTYINLNAVKHGLVDLPEDWEFSSYNEYTGNAPKITLAVFKDYIDISPSDYKIFAHDNVPRIKELGRIQKTEKGLNSLPHTRSGAKA